MRLVFRIYEIESFAEAPPGEPNPSMQTVFFDAQLCSDIEGEGAYTLGRLFFAPGFLEQMGFDTENVTLELVDERRDNVRVLATERASGTHEAA